MVQLLWKTLWQLLKKLKIELLYDPAIPLLGMYPKDSKAESERDTCTSMFTAALFVIVKRQKQPTCPPMGEWINKMWYIHTMEY